MHHAESWRDSGGPKRTELYRDKFSQYVKDITVLHLPLAIGKSWSCSETGILDRFWLEFSAVIPGLGGAESNEGIAVFGRPEGVHLEAGA